MASRNRLNLIQFFTDRTSGAVKKIDNELNNLYDLINSVIKGEAQSSPQVGDLKYDTSTNTWYRYDGSNWVYATPRRVELTGAITGGGNLNIGNGIITIPVSVVWSEFDNRYEQKAENKSFSLTANTDAVILTASGTFITLLKVFHAGGMTEIIVGNETIIEVNVRQGVAINSIKLYDDGNNNYELVINSADSNIVVEKYDFIGNSSFGDGGAVSSGFNLKKEFNSIAIGYTKYLVALAGRHNKTLHKVDCHNGWATFIPFGSRDVVYEISTKKTKPSIIMTAEGLDNNLTLHIDGDYYTMEQPIQATYFTTEVEWSALESVAEGFTMNTNEKLFIYRRKTKVEQYRELRLVGLDFEVDSNVDFVITIDGTEVYRKSGSNFGTMQTTLLAVDNTQDRVVDIRMFFEAKADNIVVNSDWFASVHITQLRGL